MRFRIVNFFAFSYRVGISPVLHLFFGPSWGCRFHPTCSEYARQSLLERPLFNGLLLIIFRLSRCHPFAQAGYDPVPHGIGRPNNPIRVSGR